MSRDIRTDERRPDAPVARQRSVERRGWAFGAPGPGMILGLCSALAVFVSLFLTWRDDGVHADDVPLRFLFDSETGAHHPSLLLVLIPAAVLIAIGALIPGGAALRLVAGLVVALVVVLFAVQVNDLLDAFAPGTDLVDVVDVGWFLAALGAVLAIVSGLMPGGWSSRRRVDVDRYETRRDDLDRYDGDRSFR